jgi:hypothetical protein
LRGRQSPTFALEPALGLGFALHAPGQMCGAIFLGIEPREGFPDNLLLRVPLMRCAPAFQFVTVPAGSSM